MFAILFSAFNTALAFLLRSMVVKFVVFFGLYFVTTELVDVMAEWLPKSFDFSHLFAGIPAGVWYFMNLFNVSAGISAVLSAYATRFIIRRIPVIG